MRKLIYLTLLVLLIPSLSNAQRWKHERLSVYGSAGTNFFLGDLGGGPKDASHYFSLRDIDWVYTRPVLQAGIRYKLLRDLAVKPFISYARLKADDMKSEHIGRRSRNLHFRTNLWEVGAQFEYYFIKEKHLGRYTFSSYKGLNKLSAYVSIGGGGLYYNPKSEEIRGSNSWQELRPMMNENKAYGMFAGFFNVGLGIKYKLDERYAIGLDVSNRYTSTDYLDDASGSYIGKDNGFADKHLVVDYDNNVVTDVHTLYPEGKEGRGDPSYNDAYLFSVITVYYKINSVFSIPKY